LYYADELRGWRRNMQDYGKIKENSLVAPLSYAPRFQKKISEIFLKKNSKKKILNPQKKSKTICA
jgi:hypothetical protein